MEFLQGGGRKRYLKIIIIFVIAQLWWESQEREERARLPLEPLGSPPGSLLFSQLEERSVWTPDGSTDNPPPCPGGEEGAEVRGTVSRHLGLTQDRFHWLPASLST